MQLNSRIGLRLKQARLAANFSQDDAALKMGVKQDTISRLELGRTTISAERLLKFSRLYSTPITFFFLD